MAPTIGLEGGDGGLALLARRSNNTFGNWRDVDEAQAYIIEGWGEGFMLGALLIMAIITIANMRKGVLLHKMILLELLFAMSHGTFGFMAFKGYGWYLSATAALLYCSYFTHNVVAWMKIRPFFTQPNASFRPSVCRGVTWTYLVSLAFTAPVIAFEIANNFRFFNNISRTYEKVRPYEPLMRDPWWVFSCLTFFHVIRKCYSLNALRLVRKSPRFGILLAAMLLAVTFTIMDILASLIPGLSVTDGINPYWKLALVFKCLTDNIMLDDFKAVLQRLGALKLDGSTAMHENSLNMVPDGKLAMGCDSDPVNASEPSRRGSQGGGCWPCNRSGVGGGGGGDPNRAVAAGDHAYPPSNAANSSLSPSHLRRMRTSLSGRILDEGEALDNDGRSRRRASVASSAVGRVGVRIRRLGVLPSLGREDNAAPHLARDVEQGGKAERDAGAGASKKPGFVDGFGFPMGTVQEVEEKERGDSWPSGLGEGEDGEGPLGERLDLHAMLAAGPPVKR